MPCRPPFTAIAITALAGVLSAAPAVAAPPPNDTPAGAGVFSPYAAAGGPPKQQTALAELAGAGPDPGVPSCLGTGSFARTVWYRLPEAPVRQEVTVDASGATLDVIDLAAFVQVPAAPPPPPPVAPTAPTARAAQSAPLTKEPNACSGLGAGGSDAAEEPTSAVTLLVGAGRPVLFQVGRRGPVGSANDERALVSVETAAAEALPPPRGDQAGSATARLRGSGENVVALAGATITEEDPAQPPCPSLATVWRRLVPGSTGKRLIEVSGSDASTLTAFSGSRPTGSNALDCVNRERRGALQMVVPVRRGRTLWVRIGTERTAGGEDATVRVEPGDAATVIDGGKGGFDPTPYGPGGGFPSACVKADADLTKVSGPDLTGRAGALNRFTRVPVVIRTAGSVFCDAELRLYGPRGHIYAQGRAIRVRRGRGVVRLGRRRTFKPGRYHLEVTGLNRLGRHVKVTTDLRGRLRKR